MKYAELTLEQIAEVDKIIRKLDASANASSLVMSQMLCHIAQATFGPDGPRNFLDNRWYEVVKIYDAAKAKMRNGT